LPVYFAVARPLEWAMTLQDGGPAADDNSPQSGQRILPLYVRILIGAAAGVAVGVVFRERAGPLSEIGLLVIRLLKALATPLILFAVLDAFLRTRIPARKGAILVAISLMNAVVAIVIGLSV